jgi:hypothetical protein
MTHTTLCGKHSPSAICGSMILFSDQYVIYCSGHNRNVVFRSKKTPHFKQELEHNPPRVAVWAGMRSDGLNGPYFFEEAVKATPYSTMSETGLRHMGHMDVGWLQHDRAQSNFSLSMRDLWMFSRSLDWQWFVEICHH